MLTDGWTDKAADMTKLIDAFRNFANETTNEGTITHTHINL